MRQPTIAGDASTPVLAVQWHCSAPNWGAVTRSEKKRMAHILLSCLNLSRLRKPPQVGYREMKAETPQ